MTDTTKPDLSRLVRYELDIHSKNIPFMDCDPDGDYVLWQDYCALLDAKEAAERDLGDMKEAMRRAERAVTEALRRVKEAVWD